MKRYARLLFALVLVLSVISTGYAAEGKLTAGDMPGMSSIFPLEEPVTFTAFRRGWDNYRIPSDELWCFKRLEELTNVHIEWEEVQEASFAERRNLLLASNDLPDMFYQGLFTTNELALYGKSGQFIMLNDLIDQYCPNLQKVMIDFPVVEQAMTMPDGAIYSFPYIQPDPLDASCRYYINQSWLDVAGIPVPQTLDELTEAFRIFKEIDASGTGDPSVIPGWYMWSEAGYGLLENQLLGSFGYGNRGKQALDMHIDLGPDGKVRYVHTSEGRKQVLALLADWYSKGYLGNYYFEGADQSLWVTDGAANKVGMYSWVSHNIIGQQVGEGYTAITALKGPEGDSILSWCEPPVRGVTSAAITNVCEKPEILAQWLDFFYSDDGTMFMYCGEEGVTFNFKDDGMPLYVDEIRLGEKGSQMEAFQWLDNVAGGYYPFLDIDVPRRASVQGYTVDYIFGIDAKDHEKYIPEGGYWATFTSSQDEADELASLYTDVNAYILECGPKFITGEWNLNEDWDAYVDKMNQFGAARILEIRQAQYDRMMTQQ